MLQHQAASAAEVLEEIIRLKMEQLIVEVAVVAATTPSPLVVLVAPAS